MAIKKGADQWFCDNCGHHITNIGNEKPRFCLACMGQVGGVHLNDDTFVFLKAKIEMNQQALDNEAVENLRMKLAILFIEKVTIYEANIHAMPDGDSKNYQCKGVVDKLNQMARKIHPLLIDKEE